MKKLFALLFSFQLIVTPVFAADAQSVPGSEEDAYTKDDNGLGVAGSGSKGGLDYYANQIAVVGTSAIGSSILTQCLEGMKAPSIATFMAGSLVHMMAEILGAKAKNQSHQSKMKDLKIQEEKLKKSGDSSQKAAIEARLSEEKDTLKFLSDRKKWMIAVTAIYAAASGLAAAEEIYGWTASTVTNTPLTISDAAICTPYAQAGCAAACKGVFAAAMIDFKANFANPFANRLADAKCLSSVMCANSCSNGLRTYTTTTYASCNAVPTDGGVLSMSWGTLLSLAYGFGASKVGSGAGPIAQYGSMMISLLSVLVPSLSKMVVPMYNMPIPRVATFGGAAVFTGIVTGGLATREKLAKNNIGKLERVLAQFKVNSENTGSVGLDVPGTEETGDDPNSSSNPKPKIKALVETKRTECFAKGSAGWEHSAASCSKSIKLTNSTNFGKFNLPTINKVSNLSTDLANALASGNDALAGQIAGEIGSFAARVDKEVADIKKAYNDQQKKEKKPTHDFDKSIKDQVASIQSSVNQAAAANNISPAALASVDSVKSDDASSKADAPVVTTAGPSAIVDIPVDPLAGMGSQEVMETPTAVASAASQTLDDFESTEQDISKKPETSIFKQLSNRYILNYTKMFETKKSLNPAKDAPAN